MRDRSDAVERRHQDQARELIRGLNTGQAIANYAAGVSFLKDHAESNGKVGCIGFCWGGGMSNQLAVHSRDLSAAVVYYGGSPLTEQVPRIEVPLLLHYAGLDQRINEPLNAKIDGTIKFRGWPGRVGSRQALRISDTP